MRDRIRVLEILGDLEAELADHARVVGRLVQLFDPDRMSGDGREAYMGWNPLSGAHGDHRERR